MYWVLQGNMFREDGFERLVETLDRLGLPYSIHKVVPFVGDLEPDVSPTNPVIVMGSYSMATAAARKGWTPGFFTNENFDFEVQRRRWGPHMLNHEAVICRFADVPEQPVPFFIRPVHDSKVFTGTVMDWPTFTGWRDKVLSLGADNGGTLDGDTLVMVGPKKVIQREYRLWIVDEKVVTASVYKTGSRVHYNSLVDEAVLRYGANRAAKWSPHRAYVMDIASTPEGLRILEINGFNAAGFYAADMNKIVMAVESMGYGA